VIGLDCRAMVKCHSNKTTSKSSARSVAAAEGLYHPDYEHDACGVGFVANINGTASYAIVKSGIKVLENLLHRGATGADKDTGDGAGILIQVPDRFLRRECRQVGIDLPEPGDYGVGMFFLPREPESEKACREALEATISNEGMVMLGWREVPVDPCILGKMARESLPVIKQCFVTSSSLSGDELERKLYVLRRLVEKQCREELNLNLEQFYVCSLSSRTLVYKGLMMATQVPGFYSDLADPEMESAIAVVHQRYSTNTFPSWPLAQPFHHLAHNGEINTLRGNLNGMRSRERNIESDILGDDLPRILPVIEEGLSDSAAMDSAMALLLAGGRSLWHSMTMLIPQAWGAKYPMGPDLRGFLEYHAGIMEPWDGPAAVAFSDGRHVGAMLDRNGLRPGRYTVTKDGFMVFASEAGVLDIPADQIREKGALRPGTMLLLDVERGHLMKDAEIKMQLARQQPYRRWVEENRISIHGFFNAVTPIEPDADTLVLREKLFGYSREDRGTLLGPMAATGYEPIGSMGSDQPLAVFSEKPQLLYAYFKQLFAQITNPAIDPIREELVMSLMTFLGTTDQILTEVPGHARLVKLRHPFLSNDDLERIRSLPQEDMGSVTLPMGFPAGGSGTELKAAIEELQTQAELAVGNGVRFLVLSDKNLPDGTVPIPALLAVSAVNLHLVRNGLRTPTSILVETGEAREVMHMAVLLGFGASAINPYLAFDIVANMALRNEIDGDIGIPTALDNYVRALGKGLLKVMSKMGVSTLRSYRNAQIFEAVGLNSDLISNYFEGTASRIEGIGLDGVAAEAQSRHDAAMQTDAGERLLEVGGMYKYRVGGERHMWTPDTISLLQRATRENDPDVFESFVDLINDQSTSLCTLRGLLRFKAGESVALAEVEPVEDIMRRFVTGAMSFGSISREAHETLAIAMNRIGGKSNSGEGGEDPARYESMPGGDSRCSAIKQVASGRFGVTAEYLVNCQELQIKIAQGAKPGEGGQLPGHKVNAEIARVRHSTPGVTLISPPPHHDIYSIEDIAQLIYDLKNANREARVSVKLVSEVGVGTIAAGVAKAHADMILISGYDGGTGASPLSSIRHTGLPWELGLSETQQTLVLNGLRSRVRLQTDGQIRTGRDVVIAAMLGAEEFGFATTALIICGCVMMRKCHNNTCPVGVATQDPELRKRYGGKPEYVVNYFRMLAEDIRRTMAELGFRKMDELIGRSDRLEMDAAIDFWKARDIDVSRILCQPKATPTEVRCTTKQQHGLESALDAEIMPKVEDALATGTRVEVALPIRNIDRTVGTMISSEIARRCGAEGLPDDTITLKFTGSAGQSFGAFCSRGMTLEIEGEANDYLGKGLSGARIIVKPPHGSTFTPAENMIVGNVLLYGATSGEVYINGRAGERFAIRNSGANVVVEGIGDHGCEYMTGGRVVVLGPTGVNFGAGMSGGIAYVLDESGMFDNSCNLGMIDLELVRDAADEDELRGMIEKHVHYTGSKHAAAILENWQDALPRFVKVFPTEYRRALGRMSREDAATDRPEVIQA
jgi:glutamate synthase domain-containing protein 2/glutamate synthase domain-containing protein 1/glutamate synthase domain-containing protein 3